MISLFWVLGRVEVEEEATFFMIKSLLIHFMCAAQVLDEYTDKLYEQFVSEGGQLARQSVKVRAALSAL